MNQLIIKYPLTWEEHVWTQVHLCRGDGAVELDVDHHELGSLIHPAIFFLFQSSVRLITSSNTRVLAPGYEWLKTGYDHNDCQGQVAHLFRHWFQQSDPEDDVEINMLDFRHFANFAVTFNKPRMD